jgi:ketosteroid isomerase-like protein
MSQENVEFVRGIYSAFGQGDVPAVLGSFDPEIEWHEAEGMPYGGVYTGPESVAENVFGPITQDVEGFTVVSEQFFDADDEVVVIGRYQGRGAESGAELDIPHVHAWTVRGGKAVRFRQFVDTLIFRQVLAGQPIA